MVLFLTAISFSYGLVQEAREMVSETFQLVEGKPLGFILAASLLSAVGAFFLTLPRIVDKLSNGWRFGGFYWGTLVLYLLVSGLVYGPLWMWLATKEISIFWPGVLPPILQAFIATQGYFLGGLILGYGVGQSLKFQKLWF